MADSPPPPDVWIHGIGTAVPGNRYAQDDIGEILSRKLPEGSKGRRLMHMIYSRSGIDFRHSVLSDYRTEGPDGHFFTDEAGTFGSPSTGVRNAMYAREARAVFLEAARDVLARTGIPAADVTHVITVSCTGFHAPGPEFHLVKDLGLDPSTERYHLGFMGCYAAFPALKLSRSICRADPGACVLIVCLELCTLHLEPSEDIDDIIATSVFADGAASVIVRSGRPSSGGLRVDGFSSIIAPNSEDDMAWTIGDTGFNMVLSTGVPDILRENIAGAVDDLLDDLDLGRTDIAAWAIHPGGRSILDRVSEALDLTDGALDDAREILRSHGNMSSPTILFVLQRMIGRVSAGDRIFAAAFGPGLTVESGVFARPG